MKFDFTKKEYEFFLDNCFFTEEEEKILLLKLKGNTTLQISIKLNLSTSTVDRRIKSIKKKILKLIENWQKRDSFSFLFICKIKLGSEEYYEE